MPANLPVLATTRDVEALLGDSVTDSEQRQVSAWLRAVSSVVLRHCKQTISYVANDTYEVFPYTATEDIWLPELPVVEIVSITPQIDFQYGIEKSIGRLYLRYGLWWLSARWPIAWDPLAIVYSHGNQVIPDVIVDLVANKIARMLTKQRANPDNVRSETLPGYTVAYGDDADIFLTPAEQEMLKDFRRKHYSQSMAT